VRRPTVSPKAGEKGAAPARANYAFLRAFFIIFFFAAFFVWLVLTRLV
jgi:hypothetical protein